MENGIFKSYDGKKVCIEIGGRPVWGYPGRDIEGMVGGIAPGATVSVEVQQVPPKDPAGRPYNRFTKLTAMGQGAPPSVRPVGAAMPSVQAPAQDRDEIIYVCGVVNNYVQNTGDTSVKGLLMATQNAQRAFRVVYRGERLPAEPARVAPDMNDPIDF